MAAITKEHIQTAAKLYEYQDTAKKFFKEEYRATIMPYIYIIKKVMKVNNLKEIPALLKISKTHVYQDSHMVQMLFMAAVVEVIEGAKECDAMKA